MKKNNNPLKQLSILSHMGFMMVIPILGCVLLGNFLDKVFHTNVVFLLIFTVLGVLSAFRNLYVIALKSSGIGKKDSKDE